MSVSDYSLNGRQLSSSANSHIDLVFLNRQRYYSFRRQR